MHPTLRIRPAGPADDEDIARITLQAYIEGGHVENGDPYTDLLVDVAARRQHTELLVAELDGRVVGSVAICRGGTRYAEYSRPGDAEMRTLAVDPAFAGRGIGAALVTATIDRARRMGARTLELHTLDSMTIAHRIYLRFGFVREPEHDDEPHPGVVLRAFRLDLDGQTSEA